MKVFQKYKKKMWLHVLMDIFERMEKGTHGAAAKSELTNSNQVEANRHFNIQ
jgi:hypothetical protein